VRCHSEKQEQQSIGSLNVSLQLAAKLTHVETTEDLKLAEIILEKYDTE
jgi:hypothetical protein